MSTNTTESQNNHAGTNGAPTTDVLTVPDDLFGPSPNAAGEVPDYTLGTPTDAHIRNSPFLAFDIETGPLSADEVLDVVEPFDPASVKGVVTGDFDESAVKYGNTKDEAKRREKLEQCRAEHEAAVAKSGELIETAMRQWMDDTLERAALSSLTGRVLAIGYALPAFAGGVPDDQTANFISANAAGDNFEECQVLEGFWRTYKICHTQRTQLIGFNSHGFDLPFIVRRSWMLGVTIPNGVMEGNRRYWSPLFVDLMKLWSCGAYQDCVSLHRLARAFDIGEKAGDGADFAKLWVNDREQAIRYLINDLKLTSELAGFMRMD